MKDQKQIAILNRLTNLNEDGLNDAGLGRGDRNLHLHRLDYEDLVFGFDRSAGLHEDFDDCSHHGGSDLH